MGIWDFLNNGMGDFFFFFFFLSHGEQSLYN